MKAINRPHANNFKIVLVMVSLTVDQQFHCGPQPGMRKGGPKSIQAPDHWACILDALPDGLCREL